MSATVHPFVALARDEQVARLETLARGALAAWGLAGAEVELIKYRENIVFRIESASDRCVMRVHRPGYRSDAAIRSEAAWTRALGEAGLATTTFRPTRDGDVLAVVAADGVPEQRQCDLLEWVDGQPIGSLEQGVALGEAELRSAYVTVGEIAARIHRHGEGWSRPANFERPRWDVESLVGENPAFGRFWDLPDLAAEQREVLFQARDRARDELGSLGAANLLIHGDLIPDNLLVDGEHFHLIDFDDCGWSWFGLELITSLFPLLISGGFATGLAGFLEGYERIRSVPRHEIELLPALLAARGLSYLGWPAGRPEIEAYEQMAPMVAFAVTGLAQQYLDGSLAESYFPG